MSGRGLLDIGLIRRLLAFTSKDSEEHGPGQSVAELRDGLRLSRDPARRLDVRARTGIEGLLDFEGLPRLVCRPDTHLPRRHNSGSIFELRHRLSCSVVQEHDENNQRNRNSDEPKQNGHEVSPFIFER
jgi:hypothetical protein